MAAVAARRRFAREASPRRVREEARALFRKAILDAAEGVFAERGFATARVQDVAARAGLAVGTIYNHFEQKEDILFALLDERMTGFLEAFDTATGDPEPLRDHLFVRIVRLLEYIASHRAFFQLASEHGLFGGTAGASAEALVGGRKIPHAKRYEQAILAVIDEGLARGDLAGPRTLLALQLRNSIRSGAQWLRAEPELVTAMVANAVVDLFLDGAAARPSAKRRRG